jgi:hypothetical protein
MHTQQLTGLHNKLRGAERWANDVMEHIALHQEVEALVESIIGQLEHGRLVMRQERVPTDLQRLARLQCQNSRSRQFQFKAVQSAGG